VAQGCTRLAEPNEVPVQLQPLGACTEILFYQ
jgi:hypothetical protein